MTTKWLSASRAARYIGVHVNTLKRWNLPHSVINERGDRRYEIAMLDQWLSEHARTADMEALPSMPPSSARARAATQVGPSFTVRRVR